MADRIVPVLLPLPLDAPFDYRAAEPAPPPGTFVRVPFGPREAVGVVWDEPAARRAPPERVRPMRGVLDAPPMPEGLRAFVREVAAATLAPLGAVMKLAMSVPSALEPPPARLGYRRGPIEPPAKLTAPRKRVLDALERAPLQLGAELGKAAATSAAVLRQMAEAGLLEPVEVTEEGWPAPPDPAHPGVELSERQAAAADELRELVAEGGGAALLEGVPGAGKTEVYLEAVAEALRQGRRVLVLLPEIALSAQWLERFVRRFGTEPLVWHSGLTAAQRRRGWRWIAEGRVQVVVGARSALFLPMTGLGLVVVDEEHDSSFKQEDGVIYHAREMALLRARLEGAAAVLASATPALETAVRAGAVEGGPWAEPGWRHLLLPARHGGAALAPIGLVDLRKMRPPRGAFLAPPLREALRGTLEAEGQALLFLNRRGYAPLTLCRACGHRLRCPNCSAWLTAHRLRRRLMCHHCGYGMPEPEHCPGCGSLDSIALSGPGVERVAEEVRALFPEARLEVMTSDTVNTASQAEALVRAMERREIDVLVGTQMIAKGHHFPDLTLVGVIDADLSLSGGDPRAAERTFQLLYQVAGRAGRAERPGRVLLQTHLPEHPVMQALASGDKDRFMAVELEEREAGAMPPMGQLAALVVSGPDRVKVGEAARELVRRAPDEEGVLVLGPAPAPLALLRGRWRERLLVKAGLDLDLPAWLRRWLRQGRLPSKIDLQIDVDPQSFL
ncbi:primosomal protein N' [Geminicoccaceae bacterium 1502E]|nr:primosomal protein N' [Geminicoccaceae bacterium 1502E]